MVEMTTGFKTRAGWARIAVFFVCAAVGLMVTGIVSQASADTPEYTIKIKNHRFNPAEIEIPAGQKVKLIIINQDKTPEEFESHSLNREKVIAGGRKATIYVGPLEPGRYGFFGEFFPKTAQGAIIAK